MKKIQTFLGIWLFCFMGLVYASDAGELLLQNLSGFKTLSADFTQTIISSDGTELQKSMGKVWISRPGRFRWETLKPTRQLLMAKTDHVWIYDPDLQQVIIRKLQSSVSQTPVLLLTHSQVYLNENFKIQTLPDSVMKISRFQLVPRQADESFSKIILTFQENHLMSMMLFNSLGQKTQIDFKNVKTDVPVEDSLFDFKIPSGVDVVKE